MASKIHSDQSDIILIEIDPAKLNIGITLLHHSSNTPPRVLYTGRTPYKSDTYFVSHLISLIRTHGQRLPVKIVIERQPHNSSISGNMRYIEGYFRALGADTVMRMAMTHGLHISSYKERKNYSLQRAMERSTEVTGSEILLEALHSDDRKHDIADSFNLAFDESQRIVRDSLVKSNKKH